MTELWKKVEGKKTYIAAIVLLSLAVAAYWLGLASPVQCAALAATAFGLVGLGHKADRYGKATIELAQLARQILEEQQKTGKVNVGTLVEKVPEIARELSYEPVDARASESPRVKAASITQADGTGEVHEQ